MSDTAASLAHARKVLERIYRAARAKGLRGLELEQPFCAAFLDAAQALSPGLLLSKTEHGDVLLPLSTGNVLAVVLLPSDAINGRARKYGRTFVVGVTRGVTKALFELSAAVWTNPKVFPALPDVAGLPPAGASDVALPRGLEYVSTKALGDAAPPVSMHWLLGGLGALRGPR